MHWHSRLVRHGAPVVVFWIWRANTAYHVPVMALTFTPKLREEIGKALTRVGASKPCSRCGNNVLEVLDGFSIQLVQRGAETVMFGSPSVPCVVVVCTQCGHLWTHAFGLLGIPSEESK